MSELEPYFVKVNKDIRAVKYEFTKTLPFYINGRCSITSNGLLVQINEDRWEDNSYELKKIIILHEDAHCLLGLKHSNKVGDIMSEYLERSYDPNAIDNFFKNLY